MNAVHSNCRKKGAFVKLVPVVVGRNDRNVGGRLLLVNDIDLEADASVNLPQAGSVSNFAYLDSDDTGDGGRGTDPKSDSGKYSLIIHCSFIVYS